jgi:hypothetical protein
MTDNPELTTTTADLYRRELVVTKPIGASPFSDTVALFGHSGRLRRKSHLMGASREAKSPFGRSECQFMEYVS